MQPAFLQACDLRWSPWCVIKSTLPKLCAWLESVKALPCGCSDGQHIAELLLPSP